MEAFREQLAETKRIEQKSADAWNRFWTTENILIACAIVLVGYLNWDFIPRAALMVALTVVIRYCFHK